MKPMRLLPVLVIALSAMLGLKLVEFALTPSGPPVPKPPVEPRVSDKLAMDSIRAALRDEPLPDKPKPIARRDPPQDKPAKPAAQAPESAGSTTTIERIGAGNPLAEARAELGGDDGADVDPIVTGSADAHGAPAGDGHGAPAEKKPEAAPPPKVSTERPAEPQLPNAQTGQRSETQLLERLAARRKELEDREKQLILREQLLKATESRLERRVDELKTIEDRIGGAQAAKEDARKQELLGLVKMYEGMKAKDAARVFDGLDIALLTEIAKQINPRKLGDIVAKMDADAAQKLTVALARARDGGASPVAVLPGAGAMAPTSAPGVRELPKIEGRPGG